MIFIISTVMLSLVLATKIFFMFIGKGSPATSLDYASITTLLMLLFLGVVSYIKDLKRIEVKKKTAKQNFLSGALFIFSVLFVLVSFFINLNKKAVVWDAVALYDARANFLMQGVNFSQMVNLSKYDPQNSYYYVLYPPYSSILHVFWYSLGIKIPVGVLYSCFLTLLTLAVFIFTNKRVGFIGAVFLTLLVVSNEVIFSSSLTEYTNLPFTLQMFLGAILLHEYLNDNQKWKLFYGMGLVITSIWIRFLEPIWAGAVLAFLFAIIVKKRLSKELLYPLAMGTYGILEYVSWQRFVSGFGNTTKIVSFSFTSLLEPFIGIFTGAFFSILIFFIKSWGIILLIYLCAVLLAPLNRRKMNFLQTFLIFTILIYFAGLYFVSFQSGWWATLGDSLIRSSAFMIPISGYQILYSLVNKQKYEKETKKE